MALSKIQEEIQSLSPSALLELFELDLGILGGPKLYFCSSTNGMSTDVVWQGVTYVRLPIAAAGFDKASNGPLPRPQVQISNNLGAMAALAREYDYFMRCKLTRRRTFVRFLDAINFPTPAALRNVLPMSQNFERWTKYASGTGLPPAVTNQGVSTPPTPDGVVSRVTFDKQSGASPTDMSVLYQEFTVSSGSAYTGSMYVRGRAGDHLVYQFHTASGVETGMQDVELNGTWQRVSYTGTASASTVKFTIGVVGSEGLSELHSLVTVDICCAQVELGAEVTAIQSTPRYEYGLEADPTQHLVDDVWYVDRKSKENSVSIEFELASALDMQGVTLPRRQVIQNVCSWLYRSSECGYTGGPVAEANGTPTTDAELDACGKRLSDCKLRFGTGILPYGGFPGCGLVR